MTEQRRYLRWLIAYAVGLPLAMAFYYGATFAGANRNVAGAIGGGLGALSVSRIERRLARKKSSEGNARAEPDANGRAQDRDHS